MDNIVVCSFHTDDEYYRAEGAALRADLERLGVEYVLEEIHKEPGLDWADMCRRKVPFFNSVCERFPDKRVFWIDVDCRLLSVPDFVSQSSADIVGFQRGFGSALKIGYANRTRFWEPCFWGVGTSPQARKMMSDAAALEATSTIKATDDYFFEDAWRANADSLTFQVVPSVCVVGKGDPSAAREAFFVFGSSGNVAEFKDKVVQHPGTRWLQMRRTIVKNGKKTLSKLPQPVARHLVGHADRLGVTAILVPQDMSGSTKARNKLATHILRAGFDGDTATIDRLASELAAEGVPSTVEAANIEAARSFAIYSSRPSPDSITLSWWARPFPGNFGDWLSPLIIGSYTDARIRFQSPTQPAPDPHLVALGSIGRFIKPASVVVGTGISSDDVELHPKATYFSVRGPVTAKLVQDCGGPIVDSFGDPGAILSRVVPLTRGTTNGRVAFVRHVQHARLPVAVPDDFDELSIFMSNPDAIRGFLGQLVEYDRVVTSAMHVFIACQSYGIPCSLVTFEGFEDKVHGTGIKYGDYAQGVGLESISPVTVPLDLVGFSFAAIERDDHIGEAKKDEIEDAIRRAVASLDRPH